jgi:hypothetical protein
MNIFSFAQNVFSVFVIAQLYIYTGLSKIIDPPLSSDFFCENELLDKMQVVISIAREVLYRLQYIGKFQRQLHQEIF